MKPIGPRAMIVFKRLVVYYEKNLNVISALIAGVSLGALTFPEFHLSSSSASSSGSGPISTLFKVSEGFLMSSVSACTISIMLATMLMFLFEGHTSATRFDLLLMWIPLVLLDWGIVGFLVGMLAWYSEKSGGHTADRVKTQVGFVAACMAVVIWVSLKMWKVMSNSGGLGREEAELKEGLGVEATVTGKAREDEGSIQKG